MRVDHVRCFRVAEPLDLDPGAPGGTGADRDLLRYDRGFVYLDDPTLLAFPAVRGKRGVYPAGPTIARWPISHRLREVPLGGLRDRCRWWFEDATTAERWATYRHPRKSVSAPEDASRFVPVTLRRVLASDSPEEWGAPEPVVVRRGRTRAPKLAGGPAGAA